MALPNYTKEEYSASITERFASTGKLFLVDYSKTSAAKSLIPLLEKERNASLLLIAENADAAADFAATLRPALGTVEVADTAEVLADLLGTSLHSPRTGLSRAAQTLSSRHKHLIVSAKDTGGAPLLHRVLCEEDRKSGAFAGADPAAFCVSDLLAESGYEFIVLDRIYELFSLVEEDARHKQAYTPGAYDRIHFRGVNYYSETAASYSRVKNLLGSARMRVALSDVVLHNRVVELYAVLSMLYDDFNLIRMRQTVGSISKAYVEDCNRVCGNVLYYPDEDSIISGCLSRTGGGKLFVPRDVPTMRRFFRDTFAYMSEEELFLRMMAALSAKYSGGRYTSMDALLQHLADLEDMDDCLCRMCFSDSIRNRLEACASGDHIATLPPNELSAIFAAFREYGVYHFLKDMEGHVEGIRIRRDNSGFEHFVRNRARVYAYTYDDHVYSVLTDGDDLFYKCVQIARMAEGKDQALPLKTPALVMFASREQADMAREHLRSMLPERITVTERITERAQLIVTDYARLRTTAADLRIGSAILADMTAEPVPLKLDLNRALFLGAERLYLIGSYGNLGGTLMDHWQELLFASQRALPYTFSELSSEKGRVRSYHGVMAELADLYGFIRTVVRNGCPHHVEALTEEYIAVFAKYAAEMDIPKWQMTLELEYIARVGTFFENVFRHTASVGDGGERIRRTHMEYKRLSSGKIFAEEVEEFDQKCFFNVCPKMLRHECDLKDHSCADCPLYARMRINDFSSMADSADSFFVNSISYEAKMEEEIRHILNHARIHNESIQQVLHELQMERAQVDMRYEKTKASLQYLEMTATGPNVMIADYGIVASVRQAVYQTISMILQRYYTPVMTFCKDMTEQAQTAFRSLDECVGNTYTDR